MRTASPPPEPPASRSQSPRNPRKDPTRVRPPQTALPVESETRAPHPDATSTSPSQDLSPAATSQIPYTRQVDDALVAPHRDTGFQPVLTALKIENPCHAQPVAIQ